MDESYRTALLFIFAASIVIVVHHRLQAARSREKLERRHEGVLLGVALRLAGMCLGVTTLVYLLHPEVMAASSVPLPAVVRWCGAPLGAAAVVLLSSTLGHLGHNLTDTVVTRQDATLVTTGPYRWVRHPFYTTTALLLLAVTLLSANLLIAGSGLIVLVLLVVRTPLEEAKLVERFGDDYRQYMATTPPYLPRLSRKDHRPG